MRNTFDKQLKELNEELITMGALCEEAIAGAVKLLEGERSIMDKVLEDDSHIDQKERDIESLCLKLLLQQQPVARDLRQISAALKMISDMERIGDQAGDIVDLACHMEKINLLGNKHISDMAVATIKMVTDSVESFVKKDLELARSVYDQDDRVDRLFYKVKNDLIDLIRSDSENGELYIDYLMVAKYFERIGDHAENIAEWVEFSITGKHRFENMQDQNKKD